MLCIQFRFHLIVLLLIFSLNVTPLASNSTANTNIPLIIDNDRYLEDSDEINSLKTSILSNSRRVDRNGDKIADYLSDRTGNQDLLILFEEFSKLPEEIEIPGIYIKTIFTNIPAMNVMADASLIPIISKLEGVAVVEENAKLYKKLAYSTSQLGVRPYLWDMGLTGSTDFSIAVVDSGIDITHNAFDGRIIATYNAINNNATPAFDNDGHGTHVAGIAAGLPVTGATTFTQTSRGTLPDVEGSFYPDILWANVNETSSITVGMDWAGDGEDNPSSTAFVYIVKKGSNDFSLACLSCNKTESDGLIETTFTGIPAGDYYIAFGNKKGAADQFYEGWADVNYDTQTPSQLSEDNYESHSGVAFSTNIVSVKILDSNGVGDSNTFIKALEWIGNNKDTYNITVVNVSVGADDSVIAAVDTAIKNLVDKGVIVVTAAGNDGPDSTGIFSPASAPEAITVGAVNRFNEIAYYSSKGTPAVNNIVVKPDIVAPGGSYSLPANGWDSSYAEGLGLIVAPDSNYVQYNTIQNDLVGYQGTSMAAPHISGLAALLAQYIEDTKGWTWDPNDVYRIKRAIMAGTFEVANIGSSGGESYTSGGVPDPTPSVDRNQKDFYEGWGAVNGRAAFDALAGSFDLNTQEEIKMSLEDPFVSNVKTWTYTVSANKNYIFSSSVPTGADLDLLVFDANNGNYGELSLLYSSISGKGIGEEIAIQESTNKELIFVARLSDSDNSEDIFQVVLLNPDFIPNIELISPTNNTYLPSSDVKILFKSPSNKVEAYLDSLNRGLINSGVQFSNVGLGSHNLTLVETNSETGKFHKVYANFTVDTVDPILSSDLSFYHTKTIKDPIQINFTASDNFGLDRIEFVVDGVKGNSIGFPINYIAFNPKMFTPGLHTVKLVLYDLAGNNVFQSISLNLEHSIYVIKSMDRTIEFNRSLDISWNAGSTTPDKFEIYVDDELKAESDWDGNDITYSLNFDLLGSYLVRLKVTSTDGDFTEDNFLLTLEDTTFPIIKGMNSEVYDATSSLLLDFEIIELLPNSIEIFINNELTVKVVPWNGDKSPTLVTITGEPNTTTNVTLGVSDTSQHTIKFTRIISWDDLSPPDISLQEDLKFVQGFADVNIEWTWIEKFLKNVEIVKDDERIFSEDTNTINSYIIDSSFLNSLEYGTHIFTIVLTDVGDNQADDIVIVEISKVTSSSASAVGFLYFLQLEVYIVSTFIILILIRRSTNNKIH